MSSKQLLNATAVKYSPLCDTDCVAYAGYLAACIVRDGGSRLFDRSGGDSRHVCEGEGDVARRTLYRLVGAIRGVEGSCGEVGRGDAGGKENCACGNALPVTGGVEESGPGVVGGEDLSSRARGESYGDAGERVGGSVEGTVVDVVVSGSSDREHCDSSEGVESAKSECGAGCSLGGAVSGQVKSCGGFSSLSVRGPNYARNRARRLAKSARKATKKKERVGPILSSEDVELKASLHRKWKAQNELEALKAEQALEVAKRTDLEQLVRCKRAKLVKATEQSFVAIEKAHGTLVATGNVPGVNPGVVLEPGYAKTVVDGSGEPTLVSGSISPDSSVSAADVRRMQKDLEDMRAKFAAIGIDPDKFKPEKVDWTLDSKGGFVEQEALDETYPDGYAFVNENRGPEDCDPDGKVRVRVVRSGWLGER